MNVVWQGRIARSAAKYGDNAPMAALCCNACRACVTTNLFGLALAGLVGAGAVTTAFARRLFSRTA
jgi:hypothetical protein